MKKNKSLRSIQSLLEANAISPGIAESLTPVEQRYCIAVPEKALEKPKVLEQFIPSSAELAQQEDEHVDPIGDKRHEPVIGLVHRHQDRCLLMPLKTCPVYCRFCFRREQVGNKEKALTEQQVQSCFEYIQDHKEIWEVILTGGDPLMLRPEKLAHLIEGLSSISHVKIIRIHSRIPIIAPERITDEHIAALSMHRPLYLLVHCNHPEEIDDDTRLLINKLQKQGIHLLSQTVLLKDINDDIKTLGQLMRTFVELGIVPYYLHHLDKAPGTNHFRVSIEKGQALMAQLRADYSGLCQPDYVLDIPGGFGKVLINPCALTKTNEGYAVQDATGYSHSYADFLGNNK